MNNLAHSQPNQASAEQATVQAFIDLVQRGYENPEGFSGKVKVVIPEYPEQNFIAHLTNSLHITGDNLKQDTDTCITIPLATMARICQESTFLDFRDPEIIGTISVEGNLDYANHLGKACLQPDPFVKQRLTQAGQIHRAYNYRHLTKLDTLHQPSQIQLLQQLDTNQPFIITGLAPDCQHWSLKRLVEEFGDSIVRVRSAQHTQTMAEFVQELKDFQANPYSHMIEGFVKPYTEGAIMPEAMWDDFGPLFFNRQDFIPPQLWLGAVPTHIPTSSLHRDPHTGFLLQVMGRKTLQLYSADQADMLYPHKAYNNYQPCWFKPEDPDYKLYPKAKQAKSITATIGPGEILVQPAGWFHQVYAEDSPNMSVSYFWRY